MRHALVGATALIAATWVAPASAQLPVEAKMPVIDGDWWQITGMPDLGEWNAPNQAPVDFAIWQAADGTWQLWSCVRGTRWPGNTRLLYGWEGPSLTEPGWRPTGIQFTAQPELGEIEGGMQAPHVVQYDGRYTMLYGDWANICLATSEDGKDFTKVVQPSGTTALFTEGPGHNTRDAMALFTRGLWHVYYTAYPYEQGMVWLRTTADFLTWSDSKPVAFGGQAGTDPWGAECPFVVELADGEYYLFRTQRYGDGIEPKTSVYFSTDPTYFGIDQDDRYLVGTLPVAAPEIIEHDGQYYIAALSEGLEGIKVARLSWTPVVRTPEPTLGRSLLDLSGYRPEHQAFRLVEGDLEAILVRSPRVLPYRPFYHLFVATGERATGGLDIGRQGVIESAVVTLEHDRHALPVSGGNDLENLYVALVEEETGEEIARVTGHDDHPMRWQVVDTSAHVGTRVRVRIVDRVTSGRFGFIAFGGLFEAR